MSIHTYYIPHITGECCKEPILNAIKKTPFSECSYVLDISTKTLIIEIPDEDIFEGLKPDEIDDFIFAALRDCSYFDVTANTTQKKKGFSHTFWGSIGLSSGLFLLLIPLFFPVMPFAITAMLALSSAALTFVLGSLFYRRAYRALWQGVFTMDSLFAMSTLIIVSVSLAALFFPGLPMMFETGLFIFGFRHVGIAIAEAFKAQVLQVRRFQDDAPKTVRLVSGEAVALDEVQFGNKLHLAAGEILPVDGEFLSGSGMVCNLYQTGAYHAEPLIIGKRYPAGTKLVSTRDAAPLVFCAKATANDSFLAREDRAVLEAKLKRAKEGKTASRMSYWLQYFVPAAFTLAVISGAITGFYFGSFLLAIEITTCVLVITCPCNMGLIEPLVAHIGAKKAEANGVSMSVPEQLTVLDEVDTVVLDLNGTLTRGVPTVVLPKANRNLLALLAHLEQHETHWTAHAIKKAAKALKLEPKHGACQRVRATHHGIEVLFEGDRYLIGNCEMLTGVSNLPDIQLGIGETAVYVAKNGKFHGYLILEDKLRPGAYDLVRELNVMDKRVYLCTGTDKKTADYYARALKIPGTQVFSNCTIEDKVSALNTLKRNGHKVAMIGDSVNDAEAIATSDFGIAVEHEGGHVGVQQGASAVLRRDTLLSLVALFKIARKTTKEVHQNMLLNGLYNMTFMLAPVALSVSMGFIFPPALGAGMMICQTLLLFLNVYRFDREAMEEVVSMTQDKPADEKNISSSSSAYIKTYQHQKTAYMEAEPYLESEEDASVSPFTLN